jgi:ATP-binding cassette subfamily B protein
MLSVVDALISKSLESPDASHSVIPERYWSARSDIAGGETLRVRGAVLVRAKTARPGEIDLEALPREIAAAVSDHPPHPMAMLWNLLRSDGLLAPAMICAALFVSALAVVFQAVLFRGLIEATRDVAKGSWRTAMIAITVCLVALLVAIDIPAISLLAGMGRRLEIRFRESFLRKLPRIADAYLHSRFTGDMAERAHSVHILRALPGVAGQVLHSFFQLVLTTAAIVWIDHGLWALAIAAALLSAGLPVALQPLLGERELRARTHAGALSRFYLDALFGLVPIRTHAGAAAVRGEHHNLLKKWASAALDSQKLAVALEGILAFAGFGMAALLTIVHVMRQGEGSALLLVAYWALAIPALGRELAAAICQYPAQRNVTSRLLEPLSALEEQGALAQPAATEPTGAIAALQHGVAVSMKNVSMKAGGHTILHDVSVDIPAGSHLAIVGQSGAGKSSLMGLILGWNSPESGSLLIDGQPLDGSTVPKLRRDTAWIDPTVQLWNRSFVENLRFGIPADASIRLGAVLQQAELLSVLDKLPDGLQTMLGEGGALVSGGEGQRVRIGRALLRPDVRLAILDEPFRGLDANTREELLRRIRQVWRNATLIFISHEIRATRAFDRVLVMRGGRIVEDGNPAELAETPGSHYAALLEREAVLRRSLVEDDSWRHLHLRQGQFIEQERAAPKLRRLDNEGLIA